MSISRGNIQEANEHLKQLHHRVFELENQIQMQAMHIDELQQTNVELERRLQESTTVQESEDTEEITELKRRLQESDEHVQKLLEAAHERDAAVLRLETKARLFYEVVEHKAALAKILEVLDELSDSGAGGLGVQSEDVVSKETNTKPDT